MKLLLPQHATARAKDRRRNMDNAESEYDFCGYLDGGGAPPPSPSGLGSMVGPVLSQRARR